MATGIEITGIPGLDGKWDLDLNTLTNDDFRTVKKMSGVRAREMDDALDAGDNDVLIAFAAIALRRAGKPFREEQLWAGPLGSVLFYDTEQEAAAKAAAEDPTLTAPQLLPPPSESTSGETSSPTGSESPQTSTPNGTGTPESEPSVVSEIPSSSAG